MSETLRTTTTAVVITAIVVIALLALVRLLRATGGPSRTFAGLSSYGAGGVFGTWFAPALILLSAVQDDLNGFAGLSIPTLFVVSLTFGLFSAAMDAPLVRPLRDFGFSAISSYVSIGLVVEYVTRPAPALGSTAAAVASLIPFAIAFLVGLFLNFLRVFALPRLGLGLLGALDVLRLLALPNDLTSTLFESAPVLLVLLIAAALLGFAGSAAPDLTLALAAVAISILQVGLQVSVWIQSQGASLVDLEPFVVVGGCISGVLVVPVLRALAVSMVDAVRRF